MIALINEMSVTRSFCVAPSAVLLRTPVLQFIYLTYFRWWRYFQGSGKDICKQPWIHASRIWTLSTSIISWRQVLGRFSLLMIWFFKCIFSIIDLKIYHKKSWFNICSQKKKLDWKSIITVRIDFQSRFYFWLQILNHDLWLFFCNQATGFHSWQ